MIFWNILLLTFIFGAISWWCPSLVLCRGFHCTSPSDRLSIKFIIIFICSTFFQRLWTSLLAGLCPATINLSNYWERNKQIKKLVNILKICWRFINCKFMMGVWPLMHKLSRPGGTLRQVTYRTWCWPLGTKYAHATFVWSFFIKWLMNHIVNRMHHLLWMFTISSILKT